MAETHKYTPQNNQKQTNKQTTATTTVEKKSKKEPTSNRQKSKTYPQHDIHPHMMRVLSSKERRELIVLQSCGGSVGGGNSGSEALVKDVGHSHHGHHHHHHAHRHCHRDSSPTSSTISTTTPNEKEKKIEASAPQQQEQQQQEEQQSTMSVFELTKLMEMKSCLHHHRRHHHKNTTNNNKKNKKIMVDSKGNVDLSTKTPSGVEEEETMNTDEQLQSQSTTMNTNTKTTHKTKTKTEKTKKSVSFYRKVKVRKISSHKRYTLEERYAQWYTEDEYISMKNDCCYVVRQMMQIQKHDMQQRTMKQQHSTLTTKRRNDTNKIEEEDSSSGAIDNYYDDGNDTDIENIWRLQLDDDDIQQTIRGLEYKTPHRAQIRQQKKIDVVWSLLEVQEHQLRQRELERLDEDDDEDRYFDFHDQLWDLLSQVYVACNWKCRLDARRRGLQDEKEARSL